MANIFFDLDGTLINSQQRLYNLFIELCPECKMSYEEYWKIKRGRISQKEFLEKYFHYPIERYKTFHKLWLERIEEAERLRQDFPEKGMFDVLKELSKKHLLYIVTNRQSEELTLKELNDLNIRHFFCGVLVTEQKKTKSQMIKENVKYSSKDFVIGDTGEDIKTAKELGLNSVAVTWGILSEDILKEYKPDKIVREVSEIGSYFV